MLSFNANIYYADYWGKTLILILIGKQLQSLLRTACKFYFPQNDRVQFHKPRNAGERLTYKLDIKGTKAQNPLRTFSHHSKRLLQCTYTQTQYTLITSLVTIKRNCIWFESPLINYNTQYFKTHWQERIQRLAMLRAFSQRKSPVPQFRIRQCRNLRLQSIDYVNGRSVLLPRGFSRIGAFEDAAKQPSEGRHRTRLAPPAPPCSRNRRRMELNVAAKKGGIRRAWGFVVIAWVRPVRVPCFGGERGTERGRCHGSNELRIAEGSLKKWFIVRNLNWSGLGRWVSWLVL